MNTIRVSNGLDPDQDQTACKGYQQMVKVAFSRHRNNNLLVCIAQAVLSWIDNRVSMDCKGSWVMHQSFATTSPQALSRRCAGSAVLIPTKAMVFLSQAKYQALSRRCPGSAVVRPGF